MKQLTRRIFPLFLSLLLTLSTGMTALASGEGNLDGGGGGMGSGTATDVWHNQDGVRVTVVTADGGTASTPFDLSNFNISGDILHFGKVSKLQYSGGTPLSLDAGAYVCSKPGTALPRIISGGGSSRASIEAIRRYFCSEYAAQLVADRTGIAFEELVSGSYKLVIEPVAYFTHGGRNYAMTATEAALYNQKSGGNLRRKMPSLTHQNLPLSIFLEAPDLGYPAWGGTTSGKVSDDEILSALGIGIVSYRDIPEEELQAPDYTYRVDTDVITSITLTSSAEVNPDDPASVTFHINGSSYTVNDIVMPAGGSQVVWAKWHTPMEPTTLTIQVSVDGASTAKTSFIAKIISLEENLPPDPLATDTNPHFSLPSLPSNPQKTSASWSVWSARWHANWEWESDWQWEGGSHGSGCPADCTSSHGHWVDNGEWVDNGWYDFTSTAYSASLTGSMEIHPDDIVPTAQGDNMKSGYGIKESATAAFSCNAPSSHNAPAQTAVSYFPEFGYDLYWRLLSCSGGSTATFAFKPNEYSTYGRNVHFTPVWYPDGTAYTVYTYIIDAWTPSGMLSVNVNDAVQIQGSLFDDWYSKRE
nr:hypothetical protein [uncultured Acetatifactor sp.]